MLQIIKKLNNYEWSILAALIIGVVLCAVLLPTIGITAFATSFFSAGAAIPAWLLAGFGCLYLISGFVSGASYIGRALDFFSNGKTVINILLSPFTQEAANSRKAKSFFNNEGLLTAVGVGIGLAIGAAVLAAGVAAIPFTGPLGPIAATTLFLVSTTGICSGLFARVGRVLDKAFDDKTVFHFLYAKGKQVVNYFRKRPEARPDLRPAAPLLKRQQTIEAPADATFITHQPFKAGPLFAAPGQVADNSPKDIGQAAEFEHSPRVEPEFNEDEIPRRSISNFTYN